MECAARVLKFRLRLFYFTFFLGLCGDGGCDWSEITSKKNKHDIKCATFQSTAENDRDFCSVADLVLLLLMLQKENRVFAVS